MLRSLGFIALGAVDTREGIETLVSLGSGPSRGAGLGVLFYLL